MQNIEISHWLENGQDYQEGRKLFEKYSRKKNLIQLFQKKYKPEVLKYNLEKLLRTTVGKPGKQADPVEPNQPIAASSGQALAGVERNFNSMPEKIRRLFHRNRLLYKHMRALHEKMKQAGTPGKRAFYRKELDLFDDAIRENWEVIDGKKPFVDPDPVLTPENREKEVLNARKYISKQKARIDELDGLKKLLLIFKVEDKLFFLRENQVANLPPEPFNLSGIDY